jgi:hypothetical protein
MNCEMMKEDIALYATGDLPGCQVSAIEHHLSFCDSCRAYCEEMLELTTSVAALQSVDTPQLNTASILEAIEEPGRGKWAWRVPALAGLAATALFMASFFPNEEATDTPTEFQLTQTTVSTFETATKPELMMTSETADDSPSLMVKLYTEDPDVVIYWFGD